MKTGVIDVGGGMRDVFGAGVFDRLLELNISFDVYIGVSAGSANIAAFLGEQKKRNYRFYTEYAYREEYMSVKNLLKKKNFVDLDYVYGTLTNSDGEDPLNYTKMKKNAAGKVVEIVATDAQTGNPVYFTMDDMSQDHYEPIKCSSCVPAANQPYPFHDHHYYDGGIGDPIPLKRAFEVYGCDKVVLILTRPEDFRRDPKNDQRLSKLMKKYPKAAEAFCNRASLYNSELDEAEKYKEEGKLMIAAPDTVKGMGTLSLDRTKLEVLYHKGYYSANSIPRFLKQSI